MRGDVLTTPLGPHFAAWCKENMVNIEDETDWMHFWNMYLAGCQASAKLSRAELREMLECTPISIEEMS